jgi:uncharacterized protein
MRFQRDIHKALADWSTKSNRKPLVLRGARQVGKTTSVKMFGAQFNHFIALNLEKPDDRAFFTRFDRLSDAVQAILFSHKTPIGAERTLIFIDEIQTEPKAVEWLRYFYEDYPDLYVIAAGSLLENLLSSEITFPVGRVEYLVMRPVSFSEFLHAMGESDSANLLDTIPFPNYAFPKLLELFHIYALIGGMPEIVAEYINSRDLTKLRPIYNTLLTAYIDDVQKYATTSIRAQYLQFAVENMFLGAGGRIKFQGFGNSNFGSREMGEALRTLEKAMLCQLVHPLTQTTVPPLADTKKHPYLQTLDTGLVNHYSGLQSGLIGIKDLSDAYQGRIIQHLVGQQLLSQMRYPLDRLHFWVREKNQSDAEVDFVFPYAGQLIPIEVKSGKSGKLKSLQTFMDDSKQHFAIRYYSNFVDTHEAQTNSGHRFELINLPYFLAEKLEKYLDWHSQNTLI